MFYKLFRYILLALLAQNIGHATLGEQEQSQEARPVYNKYAPLSERLYYMADIANEYYKKPYDDYDYTLPRDNIKIGQITVNRAVHSLHHGIRQAALAVDFINYLLAHGEPKSPMVKALAAKVKKDRRFFDKVALMAMLGRAGRGSDASFSEAPDANMFYTQRSIDIFQNEAKKLDIFEDIDTYAYGIEWIRTTKTKNNALTNYLAIVFKTAHLLDLRRLSHSKNYPMEKIKEELYTAWGRTKAIFSSEENYEQAWSYLWEKAGEYLTNTGDRNPQMRVYRFQPLFAELSLNPHALVNAVFFTSLND